MATVESHLVDCIQTKMRAESELLMREHHEDSLVQKLTDFRHTLLSVSKDDRHKITFKTNTVTDVLVKWWFKLN